jgi:hypothetical protein
VFIVALFAVTYTTGGQVTGHPLGVTITLLLVGEHGLVGVAESEVQGLGREVTDDVGSVTAPQGENTLVLGSSAEALGNTVVLAVETTGLEHLILRGVLDAILYVTQLIGMRHTWFWMRSLTRSMGAAAVFETAAETPPTIDKQSAAATCGIIRVDMLRVDYDANWNRNR